MVGGELDWTILEFFHNLSDSFILWNKTSYVVAFAAVQNFHESLNERILCTVEIFYYIKMELHTRRSGEYISHLLLQKKITFKLLISAT